MSAQETLTNEDVLVLFESVARDIARRVGNYLDADTPAGLLDGLRFAERAKGIVHDLNFARGNFSDLDGALFYAPLMFTDLLAQSSFDDLPSGGHTPRSVLRHEQAATAERDRNAAELIASVDLGEESVLDALRAVAAGGPVQVRDVALHLCPDAAPPDTPGRQQLINRVSSVILKLEKKHAVTKASEADWGRTCRWALPVEEASDGS